MDFEVWNKKDFIRFPYCLPRSSCLKLWSYLLFLWVLDLPSLPPHHNGQRTLLAADAFAQINNTVSSYYGNDDPAATYQQIPAPSPRPFLTGFDSAELEVCDGCRLGENGEMCSGVEQGECDCSSKSAVCKCFSSWTGDTCQYQLSKVTCEKMRHCILCQVHKSGPLTEGNDCEFFCHRDYPRPLIVRNLHFQDDEYLCSFLHQKKISDSEPQTQDCRYFFKYGPFNPDGSLDSSNFYIVAQQSMECGKRVRFPRLKETTPYSKNNNSFYIFSKGYEDAIRRSNLDELEKEVMKKNRFITVVIVFVFIALPFVTCVFSLIYNFSNLPCGLCNVFRQSSSKYLRNVRPYPSPVYYRADDRDVITYL